MKMIALTAYPASAVAIKHQKYPSRWLPGLCIAVVGGLLAGCGNLNSIHRPLHTASGTGALIDAKRRAIIVSQRTDVVEVTRTPAATPMKDALPRYVACAEPSPDAMSAYAAEFAAELALSPLGTDGTNRSAAVKGALQEAAAFIGMRTPSIQLLRDAMYRVCEAYANGAIGGG